MLRCDGHAVQLRLQYWRECGCCVLAIGMNPRRYATLKRGDIITAVNEEVVLDMEYREIMQELLKAGMPVTLTVLSGRIDFVKRRAVEYVVSRCGVLRARFSCVGEDDVPSL